MKDVIDTGDTVRHLPTNEEWIVAYVRGDKLAWCGWPEGEANVEDCDFVDWASDAERIALLQKMAEMDGDDARGRYARERMSRPMWKQRGADNGNGDA